MKKNLIIIFIFFIHTLSYSQEIDNRNYDIGVYGAMGYNIHNSEFNYLPQYPSCCPNYESGSGFGLNFGLVSNYVIMDNLKVGLQLGYSDLSALITKEEFKKDGFDNSSGGVSDGIIRHDLDANLTSIVLEPRITYSILNDLFVYAGLGVNYLSSASISQKETLVHPTDVTFNNGKITRNEVSGEVFNLNNILPSLTVGCMLELPLTNNRDFYLAPYVSFTQLFGNVTSDVTWSLSTFKGGIQLTYAFRESEEIIAPIVRETIPPPPPALISSIESNLEVRIKEIFSQDTIYKKYDKDLRFEAILGYVFFEENSSVIPSRYNSINSKEAELFTVDELDFDNSLSGYHNVLNILGQRFKRNPEVKVDLIGCNADYGSEVNNKQLSNNRAIAIRDYFVKVWGLDSNRFAIKSRNLPQTPSSIDLEYGREENRRVEIIPHDWDIFKPQLMSDTTNSNSNQFEVEFVSNVNSAVKLDKWQIEAKDNQTVIKEFSGLEVVPSSLLWEPKPNSNITMDYLKNLEYTLNAVDTLGYSKIVKANVSDITDYSSKNNYVEKQEQLPLIEKYNLILFGYNIADIPPAAELTLKELKDKIADKSKIVSIEGYSDVNGDEEYNLKLSTERALIVAKELGVSADKAIGRGKVKNEIYDNKLPEGRFYSRSVIVTLENNK